MLDVAVAAAVGSSAAAAAAGCTGLRSPAAHTAAVRTAGIADRLAVGHIAGSCCIPAGDTAVRIVHIAGSRHRTAGIAAQA